ncbi:retrotransposon protein, putative, ty3-gypsy subclass [Tanacetum coccineum]
MYDRYVFGTGSTHSMVPLTFAKHLKVPSTLLDHALSISTPMGNIVVISHEFRRFPLRVGDNIRFANLFPLEMSDFDIILGMDCLTEHRATIDYHRKRVIFGDLNNPEFNYPWFPTRITTEVRMAFLGHIVLADGITMDPDKVEAITKWPRPMTMTEVDDHGVMWYSNRLHVPDDSPLREVVLTEAHISLFSIHPSSTKMYRDLKQNFCGLLQRLDIPTWKWDQIFMDFVTGLPRTFKKNDAIWVVVDRLTKSTHFLPIQQGYSVSKLADIFQQEIIRLHGTPASIVFDRDPRFTSRI